MNNTSRLSLNNQIKQAAERSEQSEERFKARQAQNAQTAPLPDSHATNTLVEASKNTTKNNATRNVQVSVRLTPAEHQRLLKKISASGLPQGEYIRHMVLTGQVISRKIPDCDDFLIDEIASLRSISGRLGGLLKMIRNAYESTNAPSEKTDAWLKETTFAMQDYKLHLQSIEVMLNGNH